MVLSLSTELKLHQWDYFRPRSSSALSDVYVITTLICRQMHATPAWPCQKKREKWWEPRYKEETSWWQTGSVWVDSNSRTSLSHRCPRCLCVCVCVCVLGGRIKGGRGCYIILWLWKEGANFDNNIQRSRFYCDTRVRNLQSCWLNLVKRKFTDVQLIEDFMHKCHILSGSSF